MRRFLMLLAIGGLAASFGLPASAQINDDPTMTSGTTGLFMVPRAGTLEQGKWAIGASYSYLAREEGDTKIETIGFQGAYGLSDRVELFLSVEPRVSIDRRFTAEGAIIDGFLRGGFDRTETPIPAPISGFAINEHPFAVGPDHQGFGDVSVGAKYRLTGNPYEYEGLSLMASVKLPTSKTADGIGTGAFSAEGRLVGSVEAWDSVGFNSYLGYVYHDTPDLGSKLNGPLTSNVKGQPVIWLPSQYTFFTSPEFLYGIGIQVPTRARLQFIAEWNGRATTRSNNRTYARAGDQSLVSAGLRMTFESGLAINAAGNYQVNIKNGAESYSCAQGGDPWTCVDAATMDSIDDSIRRWGVQFGLSYSTSRRLPLVFAGTAPRAVPLLNGAPTLSCRAERTSLRQGESVRLVATTSDPDGDNVEVMWDAAAGSLSSRTGDTVTWNTRGVPAGSGRIVARANDGYGGTADCEVRVSVTAPPAPSEPTILEFACAEFSSGSSRIDNRCKAVLDDVALQMRNNPGATAVINGHSDSRGSDDANNTAAMERADNARMYLMETHGIDGSRISANGMGSGEPMADNSTAEGRSQNRRIEIVVTIPPR
ncbi:MAG: OmpA family protein [Acidobacteria bacterium]|nr:OmpA family protein [Acidobacteriota bacterium]